MEAQTKRVKRRRESARLDEMTAQWWSEVNDSRRAELDLLEEVAELNPLEGDYLLEK